MGTFAGPSLVSTVVGAIIYRLKFVLLISSRPLFSPSLGSATLLPLPFSGVTLYPYRTAMSMYCNTKKTYMVEFNVSCLPCLMCVDRTRLEGRSKWADSMYDSTSVQTRRRYNLVIGAGIYRRGLGGEGVAGGRRG